MYQVIIIEDDPMVASINRQYVEVDPDFHVKKILKSGTDALSYLGREDPDLILLDYYTPLMNGMEFIDRLHGMGKAPSIIMVTSASDTATVEQLLSRGVLDYLVKPFEYVRFRAALEKFRKTKQFLEKASATVRQEDLDRLLMEQKPAVSLQPLGKGLNETTLDIIRTFLMENRDSMFTSEQIAGQVHLSRITIRRYTNYMVDTGELLSVIDYQTGGRPSIKYRYGKHPGRPGSGTGRPG